jgi:hypothetical protein
MDASGSHASSRMALLMALLRCSDARTELRTEDESEIFQKKKGRDAAQESALCGWISSGMAAGPPGNGAHHAGPMLRPLDSARARHAGPRAKPRTASHRARRRHAIG